jgi:hypothetical protein
MQENDPARGVGCVCVGCVCVCWGVHQVRARYARARGLERLLQEDDPTRDVAEDAEPTVCVCVCVCVCVFVYCKLCKLCKLMPLVGYAWCRSWDL